MEKLEKDIDRLHIKKFGRRRTQAENLKKLGEEYGELVEAVLNNDIVEMRKECADCIISLVTVLQTYCNTSYVDIENIISDKLDELYKRNKIERYT